MSPVPIEPHVTRKVRQVELGLDALKLDAVREQALIAAGAGALECEDHRVLSFERHPAKLYVAKPDQSVWTPVLQRVRICIRISENGPVLPRPEWPQFAVGVAQTERGLSRIHSCAEQLELKLSLQLTILGRGC